MSWKEQLAEIERHFGYHEKRNWKPAIKLVKNLVEKCPNDVEIYIRTIYLVHNILVEEEFSSDEHDEMADLLKRYFDESYCQFSENAEYLFFIGKILHIAGWYFGYDDDRFAIEMQKKAMDKEPGNLLYEWAYRMSCSGDIVERYLANQIIEYEEEKVNWLMSKGFPGYYVLEQLQISNQKYLESKGKNEVFA